ncbi:aromatic ring-hydroxylating dioxygenase subunit alpha [soil metagenome]
MSRVEELTRQREPGKSLHGGFYTEEEVFDEDLRQVFHKNWLYAGHVSEIPAPGDYFTLQVGEESLIIVRDGEGVIHAHFDVCRHRGSRISACEEGRTRSFICPYHQWVYALDGSLTNARLMGEGFDKNRYRLHSAALREVEGLLFVCLSPEEAPDFEPFAEALRPQLAPHGLDRSKVVAHHRYEVAANWKVLVENNRECYHCRVSHPEFSASNYDLGLPGDPRADADYEATLQQEYERWREMGLAPADVSFPGGAPYRISRLPLKEGYLTESLDGSLTAPLMGDLDSPESGSLRLITLPNLWAHANCDYAMTTRLLPLGPEKTRVDVCFFVREDAVEGTDYDPERVAHVWKATSEEDWELCENNQAGLRSRAYEPGPLSPLTEHSVEEFAEWYVDRLDPTGMFRQPCLLQTTKNVLDLTPTG